ncbi:MAG: hypothetical protein GTN98_15450 [Woeseiaceae bacterium]|nr:hypothetical protein [Woeseiaceae bacterium]
MPEITPLGWFHTALGIVALSSGVYTLARYKEILLRTGSGKIYLLATLVTAATALGIFQHGGFGPGHALAIATVLALATGTVAATTGLFGKLSRYMQAISYSATLLFHTVPAVTDGLMRLPKGDPVVASLDDPILRTCYLVLVVLFLIGISLQLRWIYRQAA